MSLVNWTAGAAGALTALILSGQALAQSAPVCSFDAATATVTVAANGGNASLTATAGRIVLDGAACGAATVNDTDQIVITGPGKATVRGDFSPGLTPEEGVSEIEFSIAGVGQVDWVLPDGDNIMIVTATGVDLGGDGDVDVVGRVPRSVRGGAGNDLIDFRLATGPASLGGGPGVDHLIGGRAGDVLTGGDGDDVLEGNAGEDRLDGGPGDDVERGGLHRDFFVEGSAANGADLLDGGGSDHDTVDYRLRTVGITATLGAGGADDGEPGEGDEIVGMMDVVGGSGDDVIVGTRSTNELDGGAGDDDLFGGDNNDLLIGGPGNDYLQGDQGRDTMQGDAGDDTLVGFRGSVDRFFAGDGNDHVIGNTNEIAENVECGPGEDTIEFNDEDNFFDCEILE